MLMPSISLHCHLLIPTRMELPPTLDGNPFTSCDSQNLYYCLLLMAGGGVRGGASTALAAFLGAKRTYVAQQQAFLILQDLSFRLESVFTDHVSTSGRGAEGSTKVADSDRVKACRAVSKSASACQRDLIFCASASPVGLLAGSPLCGQLGLEVMDLGRARAFTRVLLHTAARHAGHEARNDSTGSQRHPVVGL